ncbi:MAG: DUF2314 domain-containing protein [Treponema sp.]|nr:DUF2314 domain-containing protein [Treponema sp.]
MIPLLLCAILLFSCQKPAALFIPQEPARIIPLDQADGGMAQIAEDARNTLPGFFRHLIKADAINKNFFVKYPFTADDGSGIDREQVWLTGIRFKNGQYSGILASAPRHLSGMKKGDTVIFDADMITDWMYIWNGAIIGGHSIPFLLEKIPAGQHTPQEQALLRMFE